MARNKSRDKLCVYRGCSLPFRDISPKNNLRFCSEEHRRREKQIRSGRVADPSFWDVPVKGFHTCLTVGCSNRWEATKTHKRWCLDCRKAKREKPCRKCGVLFADSSGKNTRKICGGCGASDKPLEANPVSKSGEKERRSRAAKGIGGSPAHFSHMRVGSSSWWGRVGELLAMALYPQAKDANLLYGSRCYFDLEEPTLGKVNVRTTSARTTKWGKEIWGFPTDHNCDTLFVVGFAKGRERVQHVWVIPRDRMPVSALQASPMSSEYGWAACEITPDQLKCVDERFQQILTESGPIRVDKPSVEKGRLGESFYKRLYPLSTHISALKFNEAVDFVDIDGRSVDVKAKTRTPAGHWQCRLDEEESADDIFFLGLSADGKWVEVMLRVPTKELPAKGFSLYPKSKWHKYRVFEEKVPCLLVPNGS